MNFREQIEKGIWQWFLFYFWSENLIMHGLELDKSLLHKSGLFVLLFLYVYFFYALWFSFANQITLSWVKTEHMALNNQERIASCLFKSKPRKHKKERIQYIHVASIYPSFQDGGWRDIQCRYMGVIFITHWDIQHIIWCEFGVALELIVSLTTCSLNNTKLY